MGSKFATACTILALTAMTALPSQAGPRTATYVTASAGVGLVLDACTDTDPPLPPVPRICPAGNVGYGGFIFPGTASTPTSIKVVDASGMHEQGLTVCQDLNTDGLCGTGDAVARICADGNAQALIGFKPNVEIAVFVYGIHTTCEGIGTTGTITLA